VIKSAQAENGLMFDSLKTRDTASVWVTSQALTAVFHSEDIGDQELRDLLKSLRAPFSSGAIVETQRHQRGDGPFPAGLNPAMPAL